MSVNNTSPKVQSLEDSENVFDPVGCMREIVESSGIPIEDIAKQGNLNGQHLKKALLGDGGAKLGLEEALAVCRVLNTDAYVRAWAKSLGHDVAPLPPPQHFSEDPVVHIRAAISAIGSMLMMSHAIDTMDATKTKWLASLIQAFGAYLNAATVLAERVSVSSNDLRKLDLLAMSFSIHGTEFPFTRDLLAPFTQTIANVYAASTALRQFSESARWPEKNDSK